jgi:hypothetical protein
MGRAPAQCTELAADLSRGEIGGILCQVHWNLGVC